MAPPPSPPPTDNVQAMKLSVLAQPEQDQELQDLFTAVVSKTEEAIRWYDRHKTRNKRGAVFLRGASIILAGAASILPIIVSMLPKDWEPTRWVPLASILAALSAGCVGFDRLYGYSGNWMRCLTVLLELEAQLDLLRFGWARRALETRLAGGSRSDNLQVSLDLLQAALVSVNQALKAETLEWVTTLSVALQDFEKSVAAQRAAAPALAALAAPIHGSLKLQISGFDSLDERRCEIRLGAASAAETHTGATKAYTDLSVGQHLLRITARRAGNPVSAEEVVSIEPGKLTILEVTLA